MMKGKIVSFKDLLVWQKAHELVLEIYRYSREFPREETYCLTNQFRSAAISVPANIAEGFKKNGILDKLRFLNIAQGSLEECRYYFLLVQDLGYGENRQSVQLLEMVSKLLYRYIESLRNLSKPRKPDIRHPTPDTRHLTPDPSCP